MDLDISGDLGGLTRSHDLPKSSYADNNNSPSFSEVIEETRRAMSENTPSFECEKSERQSGQDRQQQEDWEQEWEREQQRLRIQRKMSDRAEEKRKQVALHRAAKRKRLLEYMLFLKETSLERAKEERQRIVNRDEKDIVKTECRKKTVYVPVNYSGCASFLEGIIR